MPPTTPGLSIPSAISRTARFDEFVACNSETISIGINGILYRPPLSLVCRQIRQEFEGIYINGAPKYARTVRTHLTNFIHEAGNRNVATIFDALPRLEEGIQRRYILSVFLTNTFDSYLHQLRSLDLLPFSSGCRLGCGSDSEIFWEPKTFDVQYCHQLLPKLRWCLRDDKTAVIEEAFERAFKRYEPKGQANGRKRQAAVEAVRLSLELL